MAMFDVGESIPPDTAHAVSVSLPTWEANVGYEEGEQWVMDKMTTGYPRFFIHQRIIAFANDIVVKFGKGINQRAMLFPTKKIAQRCLEFIQRRSAQKIDVEIIHLVLDPTKNTPEVLQYVLPAVSAVLYPADTHPFFKQYWQHSGDGVSSRRAEFCHGLFKDGLLIQEQPPHSPRLKKMCRGPRRYQRPSSIDHTNGTATENLESSQFLEERYGRNLNISLVENATSAVRRRIAGVLTGDVDLTTKLPAMDSNARGVSNFREDDIYLLPCGMNAIFQTHQILLRAREPRKSISFGFPYVDTLKILEKWGPGCLFYGHGAAEDLDELETRLKDGENFLGFFCEFPGNPMLSCPDLQRIRKLADAYDFAVVVDETIGTFVNINVLPFADVVVSSLTKIFSGDCNVMGGSIVLNPNSRYYKTLKTTLETEFDDTYWAEDILFMERNSRDFINRIDRVNANAEAICEVLLTHQSVSKIYYPKYNKDRPNYEACKSPGGGYGGLLSCVFKEKAQAIAFFDAIHTAKGPSLGTNFTLTSPYVILAHYGELEWAASMGVDPNLLRISVGLEETEQLKTIFLEALKATEGASM
ncbi:pyridoxal phosphate-dependent transferase [Pseudomassariella vexata]|uniref:cystathionine gamma-synthase n=1 Tax=Pseudomassariella vexata TaxID=1141098 RepID=A0A1Y2E872_9PEZI|nr:pyridoxal phosphate-dependent transferase [Pseudomassariella vexata]ORY67055.1 pyridoxal phosphate-dependent transferase [Pseudomassariella vexata]